MNKDLAIVLVSGGMDSCVTAAMAAEKYQMAFLHINYGQKTERRELQAFNELASHYNVTRRLVVDIQYLKEIGGSSLTDSEIAVTEADLETTEIPSSYVPFRNANILAIATSWGEVIGAKAIFIGAMEEDSSGYPDCRRVFYDAFEKVINLGTRPETHIEIISPIINMTKAEVIRTAKRLNAPLQLTWSCYQSENIACGICDSCALRLRGFRLAGVEDPIPYARKDSV